MCVLVTSYLDQSFSYQLFGQQLSGIRVTAPLAWDAWFFTLTNGLGIVDQLLSHRNTRCSGVDPRDGK